MDNLRFTDKFTESLAKLLYKYDEVPFRLNEKDMEKYLKTVIENGDCIKDLFDGQSDKMPEWRNKKEKFDDGYSQDKCLYTSKQGSYLCGIFMLLFVINENMKEENFYEIERIQNINMYVNMLNTFISSLIMDYDFEQYGTIDFNAKYMPNLMVKEYIENIYKTELLLYQYQEVRGNLEPKLEKGMIELNKKIDKEIITTSVSFMQLQAILLLMESSKLYPEYIKKISKSILLIFKEILANARIEKIEIDSSISAGVIRQRIKKTTGMKIFFALENTDRYCLRIDFPHNDVGYLHLNLHEPNRETAIPLNSRQYNLLKIKYGDLSDMFFKFGNLYWFRYHFEERVKKCHLAKGEEDISSQFIADMKKIFSKQSHYRLVEDNITKENMSEFIAEFGRALIHTQVRETSYGYTEVENIDEELTKIKMKDIMINAFGLYQRFYIEEQIFQASYKVVFEKLKRKLLNALFDEFSSEVTILGKREDYEEMNLEEIFTLLEYIVGL